MLHSTQLRAEVQTWSCVPLPSPPAPQQLTRLLALTFSIAGLRFVSSFHQAQVSWMMPRSINCFHAGETKGVPRMAAQFQAIWKHLDLGHRVEGMYLQGEHLEKETASRCVWAKMLLKCKLGLCCPASQGLRKRLCAGDSEAAAVGELWVQMCLQMCSRCREWCGSWLARVSHCFLSYQPSHSIPHAEYFFQMWKCHTKAELCGTGEQRGWGWGAALCGHRY